MALLPNKSRRCIDRYDASTTSGIVVTDSSAGKERVLV
jgi:hypothetical protein